MGWFSQLAHPGLVIPKFRNNMVAALESTYAEKSWLQFKTVTKKIRELELKYGLDLSLPWGLPEKMNFIMSCSDQDLKADSIKVYFSKVKLWLWLH